MEELKGTVEVARGISDFGMMAVVSAFYLIITAIMMVFFIKWFIKVVNGLMEQQSTTIKELLEETKKQSESLDDISTVLMDEVLMRIKTVSGLAFDLTVEKVCRLIKKVKQENNIADKEGTRKKIRMLLQNIHDGRNSKFDNFSYSGKPLSFYTEDSWVEDIAQIVELEVYASKENNGRTYSNVKLAYDRIKIEFYRNLKRK